MTIQLGAQQREPFIPELLVLGVLIALGAQEVAQNFQQLELNMAKLRSRQEKMACVFTASTNCRR